MNHRTARGVVLGALAELGQPAMTPQALQALQAVASFESNYGEPSHPPQWKGSNNWGAVHSTKPNPPCDPATEFEWRDYNPSLKKMVPTCFVKEPSPQAGAKRYLRHLVTKPLVRLALETGDADAVALAMYDSGYFTGVKESPTGSAAERRALNSAGYATGIARNASLIAAGIPEPLFVARRGLLLPASGGGQTAPPVPPVPPARPEPPASPGGVLALAALAALGLYAATKGARLMSHQGTMALIASRGPTLTSERTGDGIFPEFISPAEARAKLNQVNAQMVTLNADIKAQESKLPAPFVAQWGAFFESWVKFFTDSIDSFFAINLATVATVKRAEQFERDGLEQRKLFQSAGGAPSGPAPVPPPETPAGVQTIESIAKAVTVVALVGGAIYLVSMVRR